MISFHSLHIAFKQDYLLLFKGFSLFGFLIFWFKNAPILLYLSRDKIKGQSGKNTTLTPTKTLPKKYGHSSVDFQITLSTYKLNSQNKNYIYIYIYIK